jgi:hypothetical protein
MANEIEIMFKTEDGVRISVDEWDNGGAWISLQMRGASCNTALTRAEAQQMMEALQLILAKEVAA